MAMATKKKFRWSSTSIGVTLAFVLAIIIPFIAILSFTYAYARPALIKASEQNLQNDALTRVQLIDTYVNERVLDIQTLAQVPSVQTFVVEPPQNTASYRNDAVHASYSLAAGIYRDKNYKTWTLFNTKGAVLLSYPTEPAKHGNTFIPTNVQSVMHGQTVISPVYYDPKTKEATIDLYSPITAPTAQPGKPGPIVGCIRATLSLNYIWNNIVHTDTGSNGSGSTAFILDANGVRVADASNQSLFTTVKNKDLVAVLNAHSASTTLQTQPTGKNQLYQVVELATKNAYIHWYYFVLSPVSTVTTVANQELLATIGIALLEALIVGIIAIFARQSLVRPILNAVDRLRHNSTTLSLLAQKQQQASEEQMFVIDSSQGKLQSVQYYTDATKTALQRLNTIVPQLSNNRVQYDAQTMEHVIQQLYAIINYLENASEYQDTSNRKLAEVLNSATLTTEVLHTGSISASEAAEQAGTIVMQLLSIIGKTN
ncbi:cache domain-containing protein [Ktedonobacteria bacterium brp13]|nr:cache domain-containing protein [Ktedonobacteria bacterium brp13]